MNKRRRASISVLTLAILSLALVILLLALVTFIFFPAHRNLGLSIGLFGTSVILFWAGGISFYTATIQKKVTILRGQILHPWWKNHTIILALFMEGMGTLLCFVGLSVIIKRIAALYENHPWGIFGFFFLFFLVVIGLAIYGITLTEQFIQEQRSIQQTYIKQLENDKRSPSSIHDEL
jgi:hypothetical protein